MSAETLEALNGSAVEAVADLAERAAAEPQRINPAETYVMVVPNDCTMRIIDHESWLPAPRRTHGTVVVLDSPSFASYFADHADSGSSRVYANRMSGTITAVFNDDTRFEGESLPGWRDHRLVLRMQPTEAWKRWESISGRWLCQTDFAEHIETSLLDIEKPDGASMLDLAQHFEATRRADFQSSELLDNGQRRFVYKETVQAKAGQSGNLVIPKRLVLGLAPWEGTDRYEIGALLRYRLGGGELKLGVVLERPDVVLEKAFADVLVATQQAIGQIVLVGIPADSR